MAYVKVVDHPRTCQLSSCCRLFTYTRCLVCVLVAMGIIAIVHILSNTTSSTVSALKQTPLQEDEPVTEQPPAAVLPVKLPSMLASLRLSSSETVLITPEKLDQNKYINEDVYMSVLTTPKHHESRFAYQLLTWLQTFNPNQVLFLELLSLCVACSCNHQGIMCLNPRGVRHRLI